MPYVIEVGSRPRPTWLTEASDEAPDELPTTTDPGQAARFHRLAEANKACFKAAREHPTLSLHVMPSHLSKGLEVPT